MRTIVGGGRAVLCWSLVCQCMNATRGRLSLRVSWAFLGRAGWLRRGVDLLLEGADCLITIRRTPDRSCRDVDYWQVEVF